MTKPKVIVYRLNRYFLGLPYRNTAKAIFMFYRQEPYVNVKPDSKIQTKENISIKKIQANNDVMLVKVCSHHV